MPQRAEIVRVEEAGGALVAPTQTAYDRQLLREYMHRLVGRGTAVTVGVRGTRWTVALGTGADTRCDGCARVLGRLRCTHPAGTAETCFDCVLRPVCGDRTGGGDA